MSKLNELDASFSDEELYEQNRFGLQLKLESSERSERTSTEVLPNLSIDLPVDKWALSDVRQALKEISIATVDEQTRQKEISHLERKSGWSMPKLEKLRMSFSEAKRSDPGTSRTSSPVDDVAMQAALALGKGDIFNDFRVDLLNLGYVADSTMAGSLLISHGSILLAKSSGFIFYGASGSGKTDGILKASRMLPPERVMNLTAISDRALFYMGDIRGKYIILGEVAPTKLGEDDPRQMAWRQLLSENKLTLQSVEKGEGGKNVAVLRVTDGPAVIVAATTNEQTAWNDEFANRQSWVRADDSQSATNLIVSLTAERAQKPWKVSENEQILKKWQTFYRLLKPLEVAIPFAGIIKPNLQHVTVRRLFSLLLVYISVSALLYQAQRQKKSMNGQDYLFAELRDYQVAFDLLHANAPRVLDTVSNSAVSSFELLQPKLAERACTAGDIAQILNQSLTTTRRHICELVEAGLLVQDGRVGKSNLFSLGSGATSRVDIGLISPAVVQDLWAQQFLQDGS